MFNYKDVNVDILRTDITTVATDAIVNAANNTLLGGGGVDGAIHRAGGPSILEQCKKIGGCPTGEARITTAGKLPAKYVIHTVGPVYEGGNQNEEELLYSAYYSSLELAEEYKLKTISFPSISTGVFGYPIGESVKVAIKATKDFLDGENNIELINFILFSEEDYRIYEEYLSRMI